MSNSDSEADKIVSAQIEAGKPSGREWAEQVIAATSKAPTHQEICSQADKVYPDSASDFIRSFNNSEGFIRGAKEYIKEQEDE